MPGPARSSQRQPNRGLAAGGRLALPATGRSGPPPKWPLSGRPPNVWSELWSLPQAVAWERLSLQRIVARYALKLLKSEKADAAASLCAEVRQMEDRLGLSAMAMLRLGWTVEDVSPTLATPGTVTAIDRYKAMVDE